MRRRAILVVSLAVLVVLGGLSLLLVTRQPFSATSIPSPLLGRVAPDITGREFGAAAYEGRHFSLAGQRGHVVVVNFFASWCGPCQQEEANLISFAWQQRSHGVAVLGVVFNDTLGAARAFDAKYGALYPSVDDPNGAFAFHYGVTSPPSTFIIDARGRVAAELIGPVSVAQLDAVVARVTA